MCRRRFNGQHLAQVKFQIAKENVPYMGRQTSFKPKFSSGWQRTKQWRFCGGQHQRQLQRRRVPLLQGGVSSEEMHKSNPSQRHLHSHEGETPEDHTVHKCTGVSSIAY